MQISTPVGASLVPFSSEGAVVACVSPASQGTRGAYQQVVALLSHSARGIIVSMSQPAAKQGQLWIAEGPGGVETPVYKIMLPGGINDKPLTGAYFPIDPSQFNKFQRVAVAIVNDSDATSVTWNVAVTVLENND